MATKYITLDNLTVFLENLQSSTEKKFVATTDTFGGIRIGYGTTGKNYAVQLDDFGKAYVNVPWENTTYTANNGLIISDSTISLNFDNTQHNYTPITIGSQVKDRHYAVQLDKNGKIAVYIPHTDTKVTSVNNHYKHNTSQSKSLGMYKYSVDEAGHLYDISAITADDIIGIYSELKKSQDVLQVAKEISWSNLKAARDNGNLAPGRQYRIIDYTTKIDNVNFMTAGHDFDIIVEAISNNELSEFAKAAPKTGDTYFSGSDLSSWELKYCIDNDIYRFPEADENGKGVIYYMKDEWNNEAPCDFKNILYNINNKNYYIFSCYNTDNNQIFDASVKGYGNNGNSYPSNNSICVDNLYGIIYAIFIIYYNYNTGTNDEEIIVNNNIIRGDIIDYPHTYKIFINNNYNNIIERNDSNSGPIIFKNSHDNFIECGGDGGYICIGYDGTVPEELIEIDDFSSVFQDTTINNNTYNNIIGRNCHHIQLKSGCYNNIFEFCCYNIKLEKNCHNNVFGICTSDLKLNENSSYNKSVDFSMSYHSNHPGSIGGCGIYCNSTTGAAPILERCILGRRFWQDNIYLQNIKPDSTDSNIKNMFNSDSSFKYQNYKVKNLEFVNLGTTQNHHLDYGLFNVENVKIIRESREKDVDNNIKLIGEEKFQS